MNSIEYGVMLDINLKGYTFFYTHGPTQQTAMEKNQHGGCDVMCKCSIRTATYNLHKQPLLISISMTMQLIMLLGFENTF